MDFCQVDPRGDVPFCSVVDVQCWYVLLLDINFWSLGWGLPAFCKVKSLFSSLIFYFICIVMYLEEDTFRLFKYTLFLLQLLLLNLNIHWIFFIIITVGYLTFSSFLLHLLVEIFLKGTAIRSPPFLIYLYLYGIMDTYFILLIRIQYSGYLLCCSNSSLFGHWELFQTGSCVLSTCLHSSALYCFLSLPDATGLSCVFLAPALEVTMFPGVLGPFIKEWYQEIKI